MKRPDFFLLGAPRCGTTSLAAWLAAHPEIYLSPEKEPHFFNTDHNLFRMSLANYERLFDAAGERHRAVGEASVWYLYSTAAVPRILEYNPAARFIVMLRNPVEMAYSLHDELYFTRQEDIADFAAAWRLQEARRQGAQRPRLNWEPRFLQYGAACSLGAQLSRLYEQVPRARVEVIVFDDLRRDAGAVYRSVLRFLGVGDDGRSDFSVHNPAKARRWPFLLYAAHAVLAAKQAVGIEGGLGIWRRIEGASQTERRREPLAPAMASELRRYFERDIATLEALLGRDLGAWRSAPA